MDTLNVNVATCVYGRRILFRKKAQCRRIFVYVHFVVVFFYQKEKFHLYDIKKIILKF